MRRPGAQQGADDGTTQQGGCCDFLHVWMYLSSLSTPAETRWASVSLVIVRSSSNLGGVAVFRYITTVVLAPLPGPLGGVVGVSRDSDPVVVVAVGVRPVPRPQQLRAVEPPQPKVFGQDRVAVPGDAVGDKSGLLGTQLRNPQARRLRGDDRVVGVGLTPQPLRAGGRGDRRRRYYRRRWKLPPAPPPRSCWWSCDAASSGTATDAARRGTTGRTALTRVGAGPRTVTSANTPTKSLSAPDAVCPAVRLRRSRCTFVGKRRSRSSRRWSKELPWRAETGA